MGWTSVKMEWGCYYWRLKRETIQLERGGKLIAIVEYLVKTEGSYETDMANVQYIPEKTREEMNSIDAINRWGKHYSQ